jgi:hypothetical protein
MASFYLLALIFVIGFSAGAVVPASRKINVDKSDGLVRIDKDGAYIYEDKRPTKSQASHLHIGMANQPDLTIDINGFIYNFEDFYGTASAMSIGYDYEYFFSESNGKLGGQIGVSLQYSSGNGRLVQNPPAESTPSVEKFSFATIPLFLGGVYRFEYSNRQWLAPYVAGGAALVGLAEKREDSNSISTTGGFGFYGTAGALLNVSIFDRETSLTLDSEYGIGNLWINLEFKYINVSAETFDYQNAFVQGGMSFDF